MTHLCPAGTEIGSSCSTLNSDSTSVFTECPPQLLLCHGLALGKFTPAPDLRLHPPCTALPAVRVTNSKLTFLQTKSPGKQTVDLNLSSRSWSICVSQPCREEQGREVVLVIAANRPISQRTSECSEGGEQQTTLLTLTCQFQWEWVLLDPGYRKQTRAYSTARAWVLGAGFGCRSCLQPLWLPDRACSQFPDLLNEVEITPHNGKILLLQNLMLNW